MANTRLRPGRLPEIRHPDHAGHCRWPAQGAARRLSLTPGSTASSIPRADAHRGESVPDSEARLAYVTSFTGSAGIAVVGAEEGRPVCRQPLHAAGAARNRHQAGHRHRSRPGRPRCPHRRLRAQGRQARLRSVAAHARRDQGSGREAGRQGDARPVGQPRRSDLDRSPRAAGDAGRVPRPQPRRQDRARTSSPTCARRSPPRTPTSSC